MLSPMDDYPIHQVAQPVRQVATSDRNFYDRYYFNCYPLTGELFLIIGLGQYPNLGVTDGFAVVRSGDDHIVFRASKALEDRADTTVGPLRIEVLEGLQRLRVVLEPSAAAVSFDLTFDATVPAYQEARHYRRQLERVIFDTCRFVQTGRWTGELTVDGQRHDVTPETWRGNRDRSWGVRPVGEPEPAGRRATEPQNFFWIYSVMAFDNFSVFTFIQEDEVGRRIVEEAVRIRPNAEPEWLGRPEHNLEFASGTRDVVAATLTFTLPNSDPITVRCELLLANFMAIGTGYGLDPDWRHGMWQGELVVDNLRKKVAEIDAGLRMFAPVDHLARFELTDGAGTYSGTGLFEVGVIGPHAPSGFTSYTDPAP